MMPRKPPSPENDWFEEAKLYMSTDLSEAEHIKQLETSECGMVFYNSSK